MTEMKRLCALLLTFALLAGSAWAAGPFPDVPKRHWAAEYINRAQSQGWIHGLEDGTFAPGQNLTAAQFLTMVCNTFFPDQLLTQPQGSNWYTAVWQLSQQLGLTEGTGLSEKDLSSPVSRSDMAQIIYNTLDAAQVDLTKAAQQTAPFTDLDQIPTLYHPALNVAYQLNILNGKEEGAFQGQDPMTRAEAAAVLCRMADALIRDQASKPTDVSAQILALVNAERAKEGLAPLAQDEALTKAALVRAGELIELYSHDRPDGSTCYTVLREQGISYSSAGENIAYGFPDPESVVAAWMASPGHRANILDPSYTHMAAARCQSSWEQLFLRR